MRAETQGVPEVMVVMLCGGETRYGQIQRMVQVVATKSLHACLPADRPGPTSCLRISYPEELVDRHIQH